MSFSSQQLLSLFKGLASSPQSIFVSVNDTVMGLHFAGPEMGSMQLAPFSHLQPAGKKTTTFDFYCFHTQGGVEDWLRQAGAGCLLNQSYRLGNIHYRREEVGLFWLDFGQRQGFFWLDNLDAFAPYRAKPFFRLFHWYFEKLGWLWCHCAAVGTERGAILLPGVNGAGKSTASAAALLGGLDFLTDDCLFIHPEQLEAIGVYSSLLLSEESRELLRPFNRQEQLQPQYLSFKNKYCHYLHPGFEKQLKTNLPLQGILIPRLSFGTDTRLGEASKEEAMNAFVSSVQFGWLYGGAPSKSMRGFYQITQTLPARALHIGTDLTQLPGTIRQFLNSVS